MLEGVCICEKHGTEKLLIHIIDENGEIKPLKWCLSIKKCD